MLLDQKIKIKWTGGNKNHYISKGYTFTKVYDEFEVNAFDLTKGSNKYVKVICDYCEEEFSKEYYKFIKQREIINKDCCKKCIHKKTEESVKKVYGVSNYTKTKEYEIKRKHTSIKKYGVEHPMLFDEIKQRCVDAILKNGGYAMQNPQKVKIIMKKRARTLYDNNSVACSTQQSYLHDIVGGVLNYPVDNVNLDIAFPNEKVYIEYDGSGHNLQERMGIISKKKQEEKDKKRSLYLASLGWKEIRIISLRDRFPSRETVFKIVNDAKQYLQSGSTWFEINIDEYKLKNSQYEKEINLGILRRITKENVHFLRKQVI